jgi:glutaminyl-tRNA synthetase
LNKPAPAAPAPASNFIRNIVDADLARDAYATRTWSGTPGPAAAQAGAAQDPARIRTRFPPEPNGYLHIGHAKSICLNFGLARDYGGACHMRFDDTNPTKEDQEFVDSILDAVQWLGFGWGEHLFYASNYFETLYRFAEAFIEHGLAYVDSITAEEMRALRGTLTEPGRPSPHRDRSVAENLDLFRRMRAGEFPDGAHVLRLKIDMASPNINMRDPVIYRIRHAHHHRTGDAWCIYPMYDYTHGISDALENITHSICTLEFEDHRPLYDWILGKLADFGELVPPLPRQYEFARLNLTYTVLSKRRLIQLVDDHHVDGWDDPRLPTIVGFRRRGYTPEAIRLFADRIGVSKENSVIEMTILEDCLRKDLDERAPRAIAVLDPLKLVIDNWPEGTFENVRGAGASASSGTRQAHVPAGPRTLDRARRLRRDAAEGLLPALPRQHGPAALRPRRDLHRLRQGRRRQHHGRPLRGHARLEVRHARRRQLQGEGQHPLGQRSARARRTGAAL